MFLIAHGLISVLGEQMFIERRETVVVLYPEGEITREYESELQQLVQTVEKYLAKGERKFAVSLKGVIHIDTSGLGAIFGFALNLVFVGLQFGAHLVAQQSGLAMAEVFNPAFESDMDILSNIYYWVAGVAFFILGGHRTLIGSILDTFAVLPPMGRAWPESVSGVVLGAMSASFELALRVAWPALLALLLSELAMGFASRTMPQLNILVVGLPLRILAGLIVAAVTMSVAMELSLQNSESILQALRYAIGVNHASGS